MKKLYWKFRIVILALKWIPVINLGDEVYYKGKKYTVCNGVKVKSWRLSCLNNNNNGWVKRTECKKVWSLKNMTKSFKSGYNFYMTSWFDIWCRDGIKNWMRNLHIWQ